MKSESVPASSRNGYLVFRERIPDNLIWPSGDSGGETPVPIPNTEVKPSRADGTPRETAWESRSLPDFFLKSLNPVRLHRRAGFFFARRAPLQPAQ